MDASQPIPVPTDPEGLRELLALYPELRTYLETKDADERGRRTVAEVVNAYLADCMPELAVKSYGSAVDTLVPFRESFGDRPAASLTPLDLKQWIEGHDTWKSPWTRKRVNQILQRLFNWGVGMRLLEVNPARGVTFPRGEPRRPMEPEEYRALLRHTPPHVRRVLVFMKLVGCRTNEVFNVQWPDVDLPRRVAVLPPERHKTGRKTGKARVLVLVPAAVKLLAWLRQRGGQGNPGAVFRNSRGLPLTPGGLYFWMRRARAAAGLPPDCHPYSLRHAFGHAAAKSGTNLKTIAELMGHASTQMTEHYLSRIGEDVAHLLDAAQQIAGAMTNVREKQPPAPEPERPVRKQRKRGAVRVDVPPEDGKGKPKL